MDVEKVEKERQMTYTDKFIPFPLSGSHKAFDYIFTLGKCSVYFLEKPVLIEKLLFQSKGK